MIDRIVELIVEESRHASGQNVAARFHSVLMEIRQAVAVVIAEEQRKERLTKPHGPSTCD